MENKSTHFLPQLVGYSYFNKGFVRAYIGDAVHDEKNLCEALYLRVNDNLDHYKSNLYYVNNVGLKDEEWLVKYNIPENFKADFELFKEGKYSKISSDTQDTMINLYGRPLDEKNIVYKVLTKHPYQKEYIEKLLDVVLPEDAELLSILDLNKEIYYD